MARTSLGFDKSHNVPFLILCKMISLTSLNHANNVRWHAKKNQFFFGRGDCFEPLASLSLSQTAGSLICLSIVPGYIQNKLKFLLSKV